MMPATVESASSVSSIATTTHCPTISSSTATSSTAGLSPGFRPVQGSGPERLFNKNQMDKCPAQALRPSMALSSRGKHDQIESSQRSAPAGAQAKHSFAQRKASLKGAESAQSNRLENTDTLHTSLSIALWTLESQEKDEADLRTAPLGHPEQPVA